MITEKEYYNDAVTKFSTHVKQMVMEKYAETGSVEPVILALIQNEGNLVTSVLVGLEQLFLNPETKDQVADAIRSFSNQMKPLAIAFACEAFAKEADEPLNPDGSYSENTIPPGEDPNSKEIVFIQFETYDKHKTVVFTIKDEELLEDEVIGDNDWQDKSENEQKGRFSNLLRENYSALAELLKEQLGHELN